MNNITKYQTEANYTEDSANLEAPNVSVAKQEILTHYKPIPTIVEVWNNGELTFRAEYPDGNIPANCYTQDCDLLKIYGQVPTVMYKRNEVDQFGVITVKNLYLGDNFKYFPPYGDLGIEISQGIEVSINNPIYYSYNGGLYKDTDLIIFVRGDIKNTTTRILEWAGAFYKETTLEIPENVNFLGEQCCSTENDLTTIIMNPATPPECEKTYSSRIRGPFSCMYPSKPEQSAKMYVPDTSLQLYKTTWSAWADLIFPISQLPSQ